MHSDAWVAEITLKCKVSQLHTLISNLWLQATPPHVCNAICHNRQLCMCGTELTKRWNLKTCPLYNQQRDTFSQLIHLTWDVNIAGRFYRGQIVCTIVRVCVLYGCKWEEDNFRKRIPNLFMDEMEKQRKTKGEMDLKRSEDWKGEWEGG